MTKISLKGKQHVRNMETSRWDSVKKYHTAIIFFAAAIFHLVSGTLNPAFPDPVRLPCPRPIRQRRKHVTVQYVVSCTRHCRLRRVFH